jgi:hypothetical protein
MEMRLGGDPGRVKRDIQAEPWELGDAGRDGGELGFLGVDLQDGL